MFCYAMCSQAKKSKDRKLKMNLSAAVDRSKSISADRRNVEITRIEDFFMAFFCTNSYVELRVQSLVTVLWCVLWCHKLYAMERTRSWDLICDGFVSQICDNFYKISPFVTVTNLWYVEIRILGMLHWLAVNLTGRPNQLFESCIAWTSTNYNGTIAEVEFQLQHVQFSPQHSTTA